MATTCVAGASSTFWIKKTSEVILEIEPQNLKTGRDLRRLLAQPPHFASEETEAQRSQDWLIKTGNTVLLLFPIIARRQPRLHTVTIVCPRVVFQRTMWLLLCFCIMLFDEVVLLHDFEYINDSSYFIPVCLVCVFSFTVLPKCSSLYVKAKRVSQWAGMRIPSLQGFCQWPNLLISPPSQFRNLDTGDSSR